jgi:hypothetical protein
MFRSSLSLSLGRGRKSLWKTMSRPKVIEVRLTLTNGRVVRIRGTVLTLAVSGDVAFFAT